MILFIGAPLVDIIVNVDCDFLKKYNLKPDTAIRSKPELEGIFQEILQNDPILQPGDSVTNSARVFQWVSKKSYPLTFVGAIGKDSLAEIIKHKFTEEKIHCHLVEIDNEKTGTCAVLLTGKNRSLVCHMGASKYLSTEHFDGRLLNHVTKTKYLYLSAFLIEPHLSIVMELVKHFLENKKIIIFNLAASFLCEYYPEEVMYLFENSDLVFGNDSEYTAFGKIFKVPANTNKDLLSSINAHFDKKPIRTLVMTRGKKSIFVLSNTLIKEFKTTHLEEDKIVDTDGAGDAFVGGYLAQFVRNKSIQDCVKCGMWAAKEIIQNHGCNFDNKKVYGL